MELPTIVERKLRRLNPANQKQASDFIDFLLAKQQRENTSKTTGKASIQFGIWKDEPCFISDDFDAPLDDFKEYM